MYQINVKQAMITNQFFVYSLAILVMSLTFILGGKMIVTFVRSVNQVSYLEFQEYLKETVNRYTTESGSFGIKELETPDDLKETCFVDFDWPSNSLINCREDNHFYASIQDSFGSSKMEREKKNVFLIESHGALKKSFYAGNITVLPINPLAPLGCNYLCIQSRRGMIAYGIKGMGDHVEISSID